MGQKKPKIQRANINANYTLLAAFGNIPGMVVTAPEDGYYDITAMCTIAGAADNDDGYTRINIGSQPINGLVSYMVDTSGGSSSFVCLEVEGQWLYKDDSVKMQARYNNAAGGSVRYSAGNIESFIQITER